jgi:hypothetical protein
MTDSANAFAKKTKWMSKYLEYALVSESKLKDLTVNNAILATGTYRIIDDGGLSIRIERPSTSGRYWSC